MSDERLAVLDPMHVGDITGALGTIARGDVAPRRGIGAKLRTFLAILGPGLIVMVGDNDAGAFGTYTQAGQNYGTALLWTLVLLIPVLYVNQEMVLRLGVVSGVGHARLIFARFGRFWGAFSIADLVILNALTIVTEFIGISLALDFLGLPKIAGVAVASVLIFAAAATGSFRRFERFALVLCVGSLLLIPVVVAVHAPLGRSLHDLLIPGFPAHADRATVTLLIIAIVGTTIAPWQLFFQQSYVIDKRITPRFLTYERLDLAVGIVVVVLGALAMISFSAAAFAGTPEAGHFQDAGAVASGIAKHVGALPAALFAIALFDASVIGAAAVSLSTAYALGDVFSVRHSLHRKPQDAPGFYLAYAGIVALAAALMLVPGVPLGLLTNAVQTLAGVLLPSATVFLLLLANDTAVMGPWANTPRTNVFTGAVVAVLVSLSVVLTAQVLFPAITFAQIVAVVTAGAVCAVGIGAWLARSPASGARTEADRTTWRMPPLDTLAPVRFSLLNRFFLLALRAYLIVAVGLVAFRVAQLVVHGA
jgi:NRAMP (natural resistance-associated macrophage protein)-like metal ion transporter